MKELQHLPIILLAVAFFVILAASVTKCASNMKDDVIIKEDSTELYVKEYTTIISGKNYTFTVTYDSTYNKYKQKEIMFQGKILDVNEDEEYVKILQDDKNVYVKNIFANHNQYSDIEDNKGKTLIVTKYYYPRERIRYKIQ